MSGVYDTSGRLRHDLTQVGSNVSSARIFAYDAATSDAVRRSVGAERTRIGESPQHVDPHAAVDLHSGPTALVVAANSELPALEAGSGPMGELGPGTSIPWISADSLSPAEASALDKTLGYIDSGTTPSGPLASKWGTPFKNWDAPLPGGVGPDSPYLEYRVAPPPGTAGAGPLRVVYNPDSGAMYYTWTHYGDAGDPAFVRIR